MKNTISREDANAIVDMILEHSRGLNGYLIERQGTRNAEAFDVLRNMVGRLMAAQYFEILRIVAKQHPDIMTRIATERLNHSWQPN